MTIYLWHNICILIAATRWNRLWDIDVLSENFVWLPESPWAVLAITWVLIAGCIACFGRAEDLAAKRKPQLWPAGSQGAHPKTRRAAHRG